MMKSRMYMRVTDLIPKSEYIKWKRGDVVIIDASTGAGKTFFVLNELVKYAASKGEDVVFLCNRISIKSQLLNSIFEAKERYNTPIPENLYILTYQKCEKIGNFNKTKIKIQKSSLADDEKKFYEHKKGNIITINPNNVMYYLFDEPQHMIQGASYDTNAQYWTPNNIFNNKSIFVFTTATPEPLYLYFDYHYGGNKNLNLDAFIEAKSKRNEIQKQLNSLDPLYDINYEENKMYLKNKLEQYSEKSVWKNIIADIDKVFTGIKNLKINGSKPYVYTMERDFSSYNCSYFYDLDDLTEEIISSEGKTLVFINDEKKGAAFNERLNITYQKEYGVTENISTMLSVRTRKDKNGEAFMEYSDITKHEFFETKILIATSIIDCGVNIIDDAVKNIVISQSDKTTFLQMLGRRRITEGEEIRLYIKVFSPTHINSLANTNKDKIIDVVNFLSLDNATYWSKMNGEINFAVERQRRKLEGDIANRSLSDLFTVKLPEYNKLESNNFDIRDYVKINENKMIYCFYLIYLYYGSILNNSGDLSYHYLNTQLSWLGKTNKYEQKSWIISGELRKEIKCFLDCNIGIIEQADIESFKIELLTLLLKIPSIAFPSDICKNLSRYKKRINGATNIPLPLQATFNEILESFNFDYEIKNKYTYPKRKKVTNWLLEKPSEE